VTTMRLKVEVFFTGFIDAESVILGEIPEEEREAMKEAATEGVEEVLEFEFDDITEFEIETKLMEHNND